jgi:hypothetical protein
MLRQELENILTYNSHYIKQLRCGDTGTLNDKVKKLADKMEDDVNHPLWRDVLTKFKNNMPI